MTPHHLLLAAIAAAIILLTLRYLLRCAVRPWGACTRCRPGRRPNRTCRACNGTGLRPRTAWQLLTHLRRTRHH